jgi:hypothetical protein
MPHAVRLGLQKASNYLRDALPQGGKGAWLPRPARADYAIRALAKISSIVAWLVMIATGRGLDAQTNKTGGGIEPQSPSASVSGIQHIIWIWFENREASAITAATAPYFASFAAANVNLTNFYGVTHPSQPNYLDGFSGSNQGITGDGYCTFPASTDNLAKQLAAAGKSWRVYAQNFPGGCSDTTSNTGGIDGPGLPGQYVRKHNPAIGFESVRFNAIECANIQPLANFDPTVKERESASLISSCMKVLKRLRLLRGGRTPAVNPCPRNELPCRTSRQPAPAAGQRATAPLASCPLLVVR